MCSSTPMQLFQWVLLMSAAGGHCQCGGYSKNNEGIHTFKRDCTTQVTSCRPWSSQLCPFSSLMKKMKAYLEERRGNADPFLPTPPILTDALHCHLQSDKLLRRGRQETGDIKKRSRNHQASRRQYKVRRIGNPSTLVPRTTTATIITPTLPTTSKPINPVIVMSMWPTTSTTMASLFVPSNQLNTIGIPSTPKPQIFKSLLRPYAPAPFTDWSSDDNYDGTKQKRERENKQSSKKRVEMIGRRKLKEKRECHPTHT